MKETYDRIVWTVVAAALCAIAINPWIGPTPLGAQSGVMQVDIIRWNGFRLSERHPLPVEIVK